MARGSGQPSSWHPVGLSPLLRLSRQTFIHLLNNHTATSRQLAQAHIAAMGRGLLLGAALALLATSAAAAGWGPCETVTGIAGCTECLAAPAKTCQMCHHTRSARWTNGKITAVSSGAFGRAAGHLCSGDARRKLAVGTVWALVGKRCLGCFQAGTHVPGVKLI